MLQFEEHWLTLQCGIVVPILRRTSTGTLLHQLCLLLDAAQLPLNRAFGHIFTIKLCDASDVKLLFSQRRDSQNDARFTPYLIDACHDGGQEALFDFGLCPVRHLDHEVVWMFRVDVLVGLESGGIRLSGRW